MRKAPPAFLQNPCVVAASCKHEAATNNQPTNQQLYWHLYLPHANKVLMTVNLREYKDHFKNLTTKHIFSGVNAACFKRDFAQNVYDAKANEKNCHSVTLCNVLLAHRE